MLIDVTFRISVPDDGIDAQGYDWLVLAAPDYPWDEGTVQYVAGRIHAGAFMVEQASAQRYRGGESVPIKTT